MAAASGGPGHSASVQWPRALALAWVGRGQATSGYGFSPEG